MPKVAFKRGTIGIFLVFSIMIGTHYYITTSRMDGVKRIFNNGETVIFENKMRRTISQSVLISKKLSWRVESDYFKNPDFERDFHTTKCVDYAPIASKEELKEH